MRCGLALTAVTLVAGVIASCGLSSEGSGDGGLPEGGSQDGAADRWTDATGGDTGVDVDVFETAPDSAIDSAADVAREAALDGGGCDADLTKDPANCGACEHDCLGGSCAGSACQPVALATRPVGPQGLATDSNNVYWTSSGAGTVDQCALSGCGGTRVQLANGQAQPNSVAVGGGAVFWTDYTGADIMSCPIGGGTVSTFATLPSGAVGRVEVAAGVVF